MQGEVCAEVFENAAVAARNSFAEKLRQFSLWASREAPPNVRLAYFDSDEILEIQVLARDGSVAAEHCVRRRPSRLSAVLPFLKNIGDNRFFKRARFGVEFLCATAAARQLILDAEMEG